MAKKPEMFGEETRRLQQDIKVTLAIGEALKGLGIEDYSIYPQGKGKFIVKLHEVV
jgi:hypothetical protein